MLRHSLPSLTLLAAFATPAIAAAPQQASLPPSTQPCVMHCEGKSELRDAGIPAPPDMPRPDGTMKNGLLPNLPSYG
jgi:hypothetical protein